jgi:5-methylcytosine-specific restriction endonuclease McrA
MAALSPSKPSRTHEILTPGADYEGREGKGVSLDPAMFNLATPRHHRTDAELLGALRAYAAMRPGRAFTVVEFEGWRGKPCSAATIMNRFGSWRRALMMVGVTGSRCWSYDPEELVANLEGVWRKLGRAPGTRKLKALGELPYTPYRKHWGSVAEACRRLAAYHRGAITREELVRPVVTKSGRGRVTVPARQRWRVIARDGGRCCVCGRGGGRGVVLHVDHIVPVSKGGGNEDSNLRTLCSACNLGRGVGP